MELQTLLANAITIETLVERYFTLLRERFADEPDASRMFSKLVQEEAEHAAILKHELNMIRTKPEAFAEVDADIVLRQDTLIKQLREINAKIEHQALTLDEALQCCLQIEEGDDLMLEDLRRSMGKFALGTLAVEKLIMQKGSPHNAEFLKMIRERGIKRPTAPSTL